MKYTQQCIQKAPWFPKTASITIIHDNLNNFKKWQSSECCDNGTEELGMFYTIQEDPRDLGRVRDINQEQCCTACLLENRRYNNKTKLVKSGPCLGTHNMRCTEIYLKNQRNLDSEILLLYKGLPTINSLNAPLMSNLVYKKITERKGRRCNQKSNISKKKTSIMVVLPKSENTKYSPCCYTFWDPWFGKSNSLVQMTKEQTGNCLINSINSTVEEHFGDAYLKNTVKLKDCAIDYRYDSPIRYELAIEILRSRVSMKSNNSSKRLMSNCTVEAVEDRRMQLHRQSLFSTLKVLIGPYAQTHVVYNVMEQAHAPVKEQGTSQQFKQRSQGIGSASISGNDSSSAPSKRRAIKIESNVSFSVEFLDRGKSSGSETSSPTPVASTSITDTTKKKEKKKKELHRCLCTLSFPTDDKKLKKKPCDSGVCVPGKCTPSECFKRLQEKYGSKKKSVSDVSSSQASQTSKKKERAGKETVVKEKGSSSISKYQESTEVKPLPEKPKFDVIKIAKDYCNTYCKTYCNTYYNKYCKTYWDKIQFWKKDKPIELKPAVIGTDISVKDDKDKNLALNAATQSGKKKGKAGKDIKRAAADDKKATAKKGKKENKEEKKRKKEGQKGEMKDEKKGEKKDKKKEAKKDKKKGEEKDKKKGEKKASRKKDKKAVREEAKTETKATGAKILKGRPLKSFECEPGVCTPKVCSPKECYERKFPPPPSKKVTASPYSIIQNCLTKLCCRKPVVETGGVSAATQARTSTVPEVTPGTIIFKDTGSRPKQRGGIKGEKQVIGGKKGEKQPSAEGGGDVKAKKQTAYSGIQFFQTTDSETMVHRQGVNIGSECSCSVEFYKMMY